MISSSLPRDGQVGIDSSVLHFAQYVGVASPSKPPQQCGYPCWRNANLLCSLARCDLSIADLPQTMHDLLLAGSIAHFGAIRQFHASGTLQSCSCGPWNYRQKSRSVQWSKLIRHVASVASFLHGQVPGEKRQDLRLNPFGNLVGVIAFVSLECVHDSEIRHRLFQLFVQAG